MIRPDQHKKWKVLPNVDYGRDLDAFIPGCPNFQYGEVVQSAKAVALGIENVPTEAQWLAAETFCRFILQPARNHCGAISISSWFRCPELNTAVNSGPTSFHLTGGAGDLEPLDATLMQLLTFIHGLHFSEIIAEFFPNGWVHAAFLRGDDRKMLKLKDATHHYERVTLSALNKMYPH